MELLTNYIKPGYTVMELFHGHKTDIITTLSEMVGPTGTVIGIDLYNFDESPDMKYLRKTVETLGNVILKDDKLPPVPVNNLDAIVIRSDNGIFDHIPQPDGYNLNVENQAITSSINDPLRTNGHLILFPYENKELTSDMLKNIYLDEDEQYFKSKFVSLVGFARMKLVYNQGNLVVMKK